MYCALFTGEAKAYNIFKVPQNGTYSLYCKVQKKESNKHCEDYVRLVWRRSAASEYEAIQEASFCYNSGNYVTEIVAFDVKLDENSDVDLQVNCDISDNAANLFYRVIQIRY